MQILRVCIALLWGFSLLSMGVGIAGAATIAGAECFVDHDPGEGNGIPMVCSDGACDEEWEEVECTVNLADLNLKIGYHTVYCRVRNDSGGWSMVRPIINDLWIGNPNLIVSGEKHMVTAECFFDVDPGLGQGFPCQSADGVFDEPEEEIECNEIDISWLSPGMHRLYCRTKDSDGLWGVTRSYVIQTYEPPYLVAGEYFMDDDPGLGNGIPLLPKDGIWDEPEEEIEGSIDVSNYASGNHLMRVRMQDNYGRWGLPDCKPFGENPCEGDFGGDGDVDEADLSVFAPEFGRADCSQRGPCEGDFDGDGDVDGSDLAAFAEDFARADCLVCP